MLEDLYETSPRTGLLGGRWERSAMRCDAALVCCHVRLQCDGIVCAGCKWQMWICRHLLCVCVCVCAECAGVMKEQERQDEAS